MTRKLFDVRMEDTHHSLILNGVPAHEQTLQPGKPFWVLFAANTGVATWLMGVLVAGMGLNFVQGVGVILLGSAIGSIVPALTSLLGPRLRLSQMEAARYALGNNGKKLPALLNWLGGVGWDAINNMVCANAVVILMQGFDLIVPFWLALGILVVLQTVVGVYGHHLIQVVSKYTGVILGVMFAVVGLLAMWLTHGSEYSAALIKPVGWKEILGALMLMIIYNSSSWTTYTADYTRYLPPETPAKKVFWEMFFSLFTSLAGLAFFGFVTAAIVTEQTPMGVMTALQTVTGPFSGVVLLLLALSSICINAVNDNSAAYSLISAGFKIPRPVSAIAGAVLGFAICLAASGSFIAFFENFLLLFAHWVMPWAAVVLVHWFLSKTRDESIVPGISIGGVIFFAVSILSVALFSANPVYTGPIGAQLEGLDIGPYVGFFSAGLLYWAARRLYRPAP